MGSYAFGDRGASTARAFMQSTASRISNRIQLTTDGHRVFADAVENAFGAVSTMRCWSMEVRGYLPRVFSSKSA